jgi:hypothetical protein
MVKNSANKMIVYLRCLIKFAKGKGIVKQELHNYDLEYDKIKKVALTYPELTLFAEYECDRESLQITKDIFLFNIVSGYAYTDLSGVYYTDIVQHEMGYYWILSSK